MLIVFLEMHFIVLFFLLRGLSRHCCFLPWWFAQIVGYTFLLVQFLGPSVFAGIAAMFIIMPLNSFFLRR